MIMISNKQFKRDNTTPIFLEKDGKKYIMCNVVMMEDNSLYLNFPFEGNPRKVYSTDTHKFKFINDNFAKVNFKNYPEENEDVKLSFHPAKMIVHVNSNLTGRISDDYELFNSSGIERKYAFNLFHILLPNDVNFYKEYNRTRHKNFIALFTENIKSKYIYLEIIVHSNDIYPDSTCFKSGNGLKIWTFNSLTSTSYSIGVSEYDGILDEKSIYTIINTKNEALIYKIK